MMYDDSKDVSKLKKLPQFVGMTDKEIQVVLSRMAYQENCDWYEERDARLAAERADDAAYFETTKDTVLPEGQVEIRKGILIVPNTVDDRGFVSNEVLASGLKRFKFSMGDKKKKFYL